MEKRNFLMLIAMATPSKALVDSALERIKREADPLAVAAWIDSRGAGIFMTTSLAARTIHDCILPSNPTYDQRQAVREVLVVEVGRELWGSSTNSRAMAWLNSHRLPIPPESKAPPSA